jgi:hypothetical protein
MPEKIKHKQNVNGKKYNKMQATTVICVEKSLFL